MAVLNIPRAGRNNDTYMEQLIRKMYLDERLIYKQGFGVCDMSSEMIINSFMSVQNSYSKLNKIRVHYMEIFIEYEMGMFAVSTVAESLGKYLYEQGFQSFISAIDTGNTYMIAIAVNAVSYLSGKKFHDNNTYYQEIYQHLCNSVPIGWRLYVTENSFFDPKKKEGNYIHGMYV